METKTQYYSKWRKEWIDCKQPLTKGQRLESEKLHYKFKEMTKGTK